MLLSSFIAEQWTNLLMRRSTHRIGRCTFQVCRRAIGHQLWMHDHRLNLKELPSASHWILEVRMLVGRRVLPGCWRKPGGRGQRQTSRPRRRGRWRLLLPSNQATSRLAMIRPLECEGPWCSIGLTTMRFSRTLPRARKGLHIAHARRNKPG